MARLDAMKAASELTGVEMTAGRFSESGPDEKETWFTKTCFLEMFLSFHRSYGKRFNYRDFLMQVLLLYEKTCESGEAGARFFGDCEDPASNSNNNNNDDYNSLNQLVANGCEEEEQEMEEPKEPIVTSERPIRAIDAPLLSSHHFEPPQPPQALQPPATSTPTAAGGLSKLVIKEEAQCSLSPLPLRAPPFALPMASLALCSQAPLACTNSMAAAAAVAAAAVAAANGVDVPPRLALPPPPTEARHASRLPPQPPSMAPPPPSLPSPIGAMVRAFTCLLCGRSFSRKEHLLRHERIHTDDRPFPCPVCPRRFRRQDCQRKHVRAHHRHLITTPWAPLTSMAPSVVGTAGVTPGGGGGPPTAATFAS